MRDVRARADEFPRDLHITENEEKINTRDSDNFDISEFLISNDFSEEQRNTLQQILIEEKIAPSVLTRALELLGWKKTQEFLVDPSQPKSTRMRKGDFAETLLTNILEVYFGYEIPVRKMRFKIAPGRSLPGTDIIAIKLKADTLIELCYVESKYRKDINKKIGSEAYQQLCDEYICNIPSMIKFLLNYLADKDDPLFTTILNYATSREDYRKIDAFSIGLTLDSEKWSNDIIENLDDAIKDDFPQLTVIILFIENAEEFISKIYDQLKVEEIEDE